MVRFGGVGGFLFRPTGQVRKCRPAPRLFTLGQTLMPEFDQPPFNIDSSKRRSVLKLRVFSLSPTIEPVGSFGCPNYDLISNYPQKTAKDLFLFPSSHLYRMALRQAIWCRFRLN